MLKNFIVDADLQKLFPKLSTQLWSTQSDYSTQISKAYDILLNDLKNRGIQPRLCMIPLDLKRDDDTDGPNPLTSSAETESTTGEPFEGSGQRRLVVKPSATTGAWSVKLQGSNKATEPATGDATWEDVSGATVSITNGSTTQASAIFYDEYKWYRYVSTAPGTATPSMTYTVALYETIFDDAIAYGAFILIFAAFRKKPNDIWDLNLQLSLERYDSVLNSIKFGYDADEDGLPDKDEDNRKAGSRVNSISLIS